MLAPTPIPLLQLKNIISPEVLKPLKTSMEGLSSSEACHRYKTVGPNLIAEEKKLHIIFDFLKEFKEPLILLLLGVAAISFVIGEHLDGFIVVGMVVLSVTLNFFQEYKASTAAKKLKEKVATKVCVRRDGKTEELLASHLVPGDIIELNAGDLIPADCRLLEAKDFFINQSSLTGEAFPVEKTAEPDLDSNQEILAARNLVFSGTSVVTGSGIAVVVLTGSATEFGKIASTLMSPAEDNDFVRGIHQFSRFILKVIIVFVVVLFGLNFLLKGDLLNSFMFAIAVAVGLTPEFLPMVMSVTMGKGSVAMAKKGVIVKKLSAIPTFGSLDVLCTDKTGTLTQDKIALVQYVDLWGKRNERVLEYAYLISAFETGITNPLDQAILAYKKLNIKAFKKVDEIPFDFIRKKMSVVVEHQGHRLLITKGAPEEIFKSCSKYLEGDQLHRFSQKHAQVVTQEYEHLSKEGFRVLAIAYKPVENGRHVYNKSDESEMLLLGYTAFLDPVKTDVKASIDELEEMGIEIKVITGDNELVAEKICREAGIASKGTILGSEFIKLTPKQQQQCVGSITLFARFSPDQKNQVIQALQAAKHVVGYMGDGINDAPSLKTADVGISVSNAVDVAKEAASIILTHKSLHQLKDGVLEGRKTFGNTMKYILMGISSNFGNMFSLLGAIIFLPFLPMLPIQILLNNFLYDFSQLSLPLDQVDGEFIKKPKRWDIGFIKRFMLMMGPVSTIFDWISFYILYQFFAGSPAQFQTGWFIESLATQTFVVHIIRTRFTPFVQSRASKWVWLTTGLAVVVAWLIPYTSIGSLFGFEPLPGMVLLLIAGIVASYLVVTEVCKQVFYRIYRT